MKNWIFMAVAIFGEVIATSALKSSHGFTRLVPSVVVVAGYGLAFYFLSLALKSIPVGIAYAVWAGLGIVLVAAIAWIFHGQKLDFWAFIGIGLIVSGVAVLNLLSRGRFRIRKLKHVKRSDTQQLRGFAQAANP